MANGEDGVRMSTIMALLNQIDERDRSPCKFSGTVWTKNEPKLLDSILRGYPVGIVLLWETFDYDIQFRSFVRDFRPNQVDTYRDNKARRRLEAGARRAATTPIALHRFVPEHAKESGSTSTSSAEKARTTCPTIDSSSTSSNEKRQTSGTPRRSTTPSSRLQGVTTIFEEWLVPVSDLYRMGAQRRPSFER